MNLQEKAICLALTGRQPELPYPLKDVECANGTVQRIYIIPDANKAKVLAGLFLMADGHGVDDVLFDLHERKTFLQGARLPHHPLVRGKPHRKSLLPVLRRDVRGLDFPQKGQ